MSIDAAIALAEEHIAVAQEEAARLEADRDRLTKLADERRIRAHEISLVLSHLHRLRSAIADAPNGVLRDLRLDHLFARPIVAPAGMQIVETAEPTTIVPIPIRIAEEQQVPAAITPPAPIDDVGRAIMDLFQRASTDGSVLFEVNALAKKIGVTKHRLDVELTKLCEADLLLRRKSLPGHVTFEILDPAEAEE